jgi:ribosome-associated toxin RatA of RatAB toxin-antitoxin module
VQKVHVSVLIKQPLEQVFAKVSNHRKFLSGGGLACHLIKKGAPDKNGLGAVRTVRSAKYTFTEQITAFVENESFDYLITDIKPKLNLVHHNGWLEFAQEGQHTRVDWHTHFTITTPIVGRLIGKLFARQLVKIFTQRLEHLNT